MAKKTKRIVVKKQLSDEEAAKLGGKFLDEDSYDILISGEDADVIMEEDQCPLIVFRHKVLPATACKAAYPALRGAAHSTDNRGMAAGEVPEGLKTNELVRVGKTRVRRVKRDGTLSNTFETVSGKNRYENPKRIGKMVGDVKFRRIKQDGTLDEVKRSMKPVESGIVGFFDRNARFPFCRLTAFNLDEPDKFAAAMPLIRAIDSVFKKEVPDRYAAQLEMIEKTSPDFVISDTVFTTITVNKNWQTAVHKDAGDLEEGFGVMTALRAGYYTGCYLVFPQYRVAIDMQSRDLCLADVHQWHGNTPVIGIEGAYERISLVLYMRKKMVHCLSAEEELIRAKNRKRGDKIND